MAPEGVGCVRTAPRGNRHEEAPEEIPGSFLTTLRLWLGVPGGVVSSCDLLPVDDVPEGVYVLRAAVLVLEVVGVLPHVQAHHRRLALHQRRVLVGRLLYGERAAGVRDQPRPPRAEQGARRRRRGGPVFEPAERAGGGG